MFWKYDGEQHKHGPAQDNLKQTENEINFTMK